MATESNLAQRIRLALADFLKQDVSTIKAAHALRNDLGLDSMARIELLYNLEDEFGFQIPDQDLAKFVTVADVIAYVEGRLELPAAVPARRRPRTAKATAKATEG